ncbi:MAG: DAK2 domain-containing protein [Acidimicrobiia bacterium]
MPVGEACTSFTAADLRAVVTTFRDLLRGHQDAINRLNVYPVPDGDTGTNMALTMASVVAELDSAPPDMAATCRAIGHGALMGGRGNSGVILSQILRALTARWAEDERVDGAAVAEALEAAAASAYEAVSRPVEGTILTVVRAAADGAMAAVDRGGDLAAVLETARVAAGEALARTPEQLPVLAAAGVVDAGGAGLLLLLDAALHAVDGRALPEPATTGGADLAALAGLGGAAGHDGEADLRYEVMYLLEADDAAIPVFKDVWAGIGDSIVVVGGDGLWNCHIHTDDIGAAVEAALDAGRPRSIRVTDLREQVEEERWVREATPLDEDELLVPVACAVVAVATGDGIGRILHSLGVRRIVAGGQSMNPSVAQLLEAIEAVPSGAVIVLPNNKNIVPVAKQAAALSPKRVEVVPTRGVAEGLAALVAYDPDAAADANLINMRVAAESVTAGEVTRAVRASSCDLGPIAEGDFLGIARDGIRAVAGSVADAVTGLLGVLLDGHHELVTLIEGDGATPAETRRVTEWLAEHHPDVAVEVHHGGQPLYPYLVGIE